MTKKAALPLLTMLGLLILSYGLDIAIVALMAFCNAAFTFTTLWIDILIEFVFAGAVIFLVWLVLVKCGKDLLVGWVFVVTGLIALFIFMSYGYYFMPWNPGDFLRISWAFLLRISSGSLPKPASSRQCWGRLISYASRAN